MEMEMEIPSFVLGVLKILSWMHEFTFNQFTISMSFFETQIEMDLDTVNFQKLNFRHFDK